MTNDNHQKISNSMFLLMFAFSIASMSLQILMTNIIKDFQLSGMKQAMMPAMFICGGMLSVVLLPFIKGRITKALMLSISSSAMAAIMFTLGFVPSFIIAILLCLVLGIFAGWVDSYTNSTIVDIHKTDTLKHLGRLHACFCIGAITLPFIIYLLTGFFDLSWREVCIVLSFIILVFAIRFIVVAKANRKLINSESIEPKLTLREIKGFLKDKYYVLLVLCYCVYSLSQNGGAMWLFHYTRTVYPSTAILASLVLSGSWLGGFFSRLFYHKVKMKPMKLFSWGISVSIIFHVIAILSHNSTVFFIMIFLMNLCNGMGFPLLVNETLSRYRGNTSMALTGLHFFGKFGAFLFPLFIGFVATYNLDYAMLMADVAATLGVIVGIIILNTKDKRLIVVEPKL